MPETFEYYDGETLLEGYIALPTDVTTKRPLVLIVHDWSGKNEFACNKAKKIASLGYIGFAVDMYGKGKLGTTKEEKVQYMQPLMQDRKKITSRLQAALSAGEKIEQVDQNRRAIIGFCFGGLCALDLARSGADIKGTVSFHGLLKSPDWSQKAIKAKILALHGFDDPMVTPDQVMEFGNEMTAANADWELNIYGNAMHAFTNPEANDPDFGTVYEPKADSRSWQAMEIFFKEIFRDTVG